MKEQWKPVVDYEGLYEVSDFGNIRSLDREISYGGCNHFFRGQSLKTHLLRNYVCITLNNKVKKKKYLHALVLEAFVGPRPDGYQACHNDGNPTNNKLENLRWDTPKNNTSDKYEHGTILIGSKNQKSKITENDAKQIKILLNYTNLTHKQIGEKLNISTNIIRNISSNVTWNHVTLYEEK